MTIDTNRIAELERVNYCATLSSADATPGLEVIIRDDAIITTSEVFPAPDANHACLLRATNSSADTVIEIDTVLVSPPPLTVTVPE